MCKKSPLTTVVFILLVVGALNWGLVGLGWLVSGADWNVVRMVLGRSNLEAVVYVLVGLAGLYKVIVCGKCDECKNGSCCPPK
jgi:uncharacterized membrane protein YuzA (DUF378 family)